MTLHPHHPTTPTSMMHEQGFALITALIFLLVLTIIGVTMFGRVTRQQHMAGNIQQKVMALSAASYASHMARYQLDTTSIALSSNCDSPTTTVRVCEDELADPVADATWDTVPTGSGHGVQLTGASFEGDVPAAADAIAGEHAYAAYPQYYIQRVSGSGSLQTGGVQSQNNKNFVYRITAWGVGGNEGAVAITSTLYVP